MVEWILEIPLLGDAIMVERGDKIEIMPVVATPAASMAWAKELYAMFAPVRQEAEAMDAAEIDALIDEAVIESQMGE